MTAERWIAIEELFNRLIEGPPEDRDKLLGEIHDDEVRREVECLISAEESGNGRLSNAVQSAAEHFVHDLEFTPKRIGNYELIREIGRGGMGAVYLARRVDEIKKRVAIKIIKRGMDSDDILRRFRNERRILASLDHPNIACLLDGGTTENGRPFFVMEFVEGLPLLDYCEQHELSIPARLGLFRRICSAVSFAHQNLIVHRDLKPSNILVTADGTPKLLDFGIAKMLNPDLSGEPVTPTTTVNRMMTPEYASPEQLKGEQITTSSDVYSLGVLLYELLTGHRPYEIKSRNTAEIIRLVYDSEPALPSVVTTRDLSNSKPGESKRNLRSSIRNPHLLRGDIDNIVLCALRKEPLRRYSSVEQLNEDLRRHLDGLPVTARPLTFTYRISKFARRNQIAVGFASFLLMSLIGFTATEYWQSLRLTRERDRAQVQRERAESVSAFLTEIFRGANPKEAKGRELTARELLDKGAEKVRNGLDSQPEVKAKLLLTIGESYQALSVFDKAEEFGDEAVELNRNLYGDESAEILTALDFVSEVKFWNKKLDEAIDIQEKVVAVRRRTFGETFETAKSLNLLAVWQGGSRKYSDSEVEQNYRDALAMARKALPADDPRLEELLSNTAIYLEEFRFKFDEAEALCRETVRLSEVHQHENPLDFAAGHSCLGRVLVAEEKFGEAEQSLLKVLEIRKQLNKVPNQSTSNALYNLAECYLFMGELDKAERLLRESIEIRRQINSPLLRYAFYRMGVLRHKQGKLDEAESYFQQSFALTETPIVRIRNDYAELLIDKNELIKAEKLLRENALIESERVGTNHPLYAECIGLLGKCLIRQKRFTEASPLLRQTYEILLTVFGENHRKTIEVRTLLATEKPT